MVLPLPLYLRIPTESEAPYFKNRSCAEAVISVVIEAQKQEWMMLHGFVVLPEALEMVVTPVKQGVGGVVAHIQSQTIPPLAILLPQAQSVWERRFLQIPLNSQRALDARLAMLLLAPVASGIVEIASSYPYSSANPRYVSSVTVFSGFKKGETAEMAKIVVSERPADPPAAAAEASPPAR
jgi:hypothetical protein